MTRPARDARLLSGAYVLDALTAQEVGAMDAAMRSDEDLRGEVAELTDTAVLLGLAVAPIEPPTALRSRLLDAIERTPQHPAVESVDLDEAPEHDGEHEAAPAAIRVDAVVTRGPAHWFRRPVALLVAAAAAVALFFGGNLIVQRGVEGQSAQAVSFAELTSSPDVHRAQKPVTGGGTAVVYWSPKLRSSAVVLTGVRTPAGRLLQLWHIRGGSATDAGLYRPQHGEHYQMLHDVPSTESTIGITVEPDGGSKQPTTAPIAVVSVA